MNLPVVRPRSRRTAIPTLIHVVIIRDHHPRTQKDREMGSRCGHHGSHLEDSPEGKRCPHCKTVIYLPRERHVPAGTEQRSESGEGQGPAHHRSGEDARAWVVAHKKHVVDRYLLDEEPMSRLARSLNVSATWLSHQFDAWGVPRRGRAEAAVLRGPGVNPYQGR